MPTIATYSLEERKLLLALARQAVETAAAKGSLPTVDWSALPYALQERRACFVSLYNHKELRGCTGVLTARNILAEEVIHSAAQTTLNDPRFPSVLSREVPELTISISILSPPTKLDLTSPHEILTLIRPGVDGVTLSRGPHRATFLPQVWERVPEPTKFLDLLCEKMGLPRRAWLVSPMDVETYQSEEVSEKEFENST